MDMSGSSSAVELLLSRNATNASDIGAGLPPEPGLGITIVSCMDARIDLSAALGLDPGDAHVLRNAGGIVTEDVVRSLVVSQWCLGTREIMVIQHTGCGMLNLNESQLASQVQSQSGRPLSFALGAFRDLETSVRESIRQLRGCPVLLARDCLRGFIYHVETGLLQEVGIP